jgi:hypothetical protein
MAAITSGEILFKYSVKTGAAGNSTASSASASLGKYISTSAWTGGSANDLFDDVTGAENAANGTGIGKEYRCIFIHNSNSANTLENAVVYLSAETAGGANIAIAIDSTAASAIGSASAQAAEIATDTTDPSGVGCPWAISLQARVGRSGYVGSLPTQLRCPTTV